MPRAHGRDRVETLDGERLRIVSPIPKGWRAGKPATRTRAEFPGTAVAWDDTLWEVVSSEERTGANSRYVLAPWKDNHAIRLTVDYSAESEAAIAAAHRKSEARNRMSAAIFAVGLFAGQLPAHVQKQIESEYGFVATRMTLLSLVPELALAVFAVMGLPIEELPGPKWPMWVLLLGFFALADILARSWYCLLRNQPLGSFPGVLVWSIVTVLSPASRRFDREGSRKAERGLATKSVLSPSDFEREHDLYIVREPYLALLPADDQLRLTRTFGFDPIVWGRRTALTIAIVAGTGVVSMVSKLKDGVGTGGTWLSLFTAASLLAEQLYRLRELSRGKPAGSVLGALARPWCSVHLSMEPPGLEQGTTTPVKTVLPEVWEGGEPDGTSPDDQTGR